jgi:hypothetical protein
MREGMAELPPMLGLASARARGKAGSDADT